MDCAEHVVSIRVGLSRWKSSLEYLLARLRSLTAAMTTVAAVRIVARTPKMMFVMVSVANAMKPGWAVLTAAPKSGAVIEDLIG